MFNHLVHYSLIFKDWPHALKLDICESQLHSTFDPQSKLECKWGSFIAKTVEIPVVLEQWGKCLSASLRQKPNSYEFNVSHNMFIV